MRRLIPRNCSAPSRTARCKILNVNLAAALDADPLENVLVQPRDRIIVHRSLYRVDPPSVYIRGEVANPGRYPLGENMRVADLLRAAGGPKRSADLQNGDLTRYFPASGSARRGTSTERMDLTAALHDTSLNFPLKDGDVLSVPELPGWKDLGASITVKGEVRNPGVYGIRPGERLSSVLKRAGGLLPTAYPQGAIFIAHFGPRTPGKEPARTHPAHGAGRRDGEDLPDDHRLGTSPARARSRATASSASWKRCGAHPLPGGW